MLQQWKATREYLEEFLECFHKLFFEAPKRKMKFQYIWDKYEYVGYKSLYPKVKKNIKSFSAYFSDGVSQSQANTVVFTSDCLPYPHQTTPPP